MYKNASHNAQSRADRTAQFSHLNEHGVDENVFRTPSDDERARALLVQEKRDLETRMATVNRQISDACAIAKGYRDGRRTPNRQFEHWQADKRLLMTRMADVERKLSDLRMARLDRVKRDAHADKIRFERAFVRMAREMLAGPVFDRVFTATIHRLQADGVVIDATEATETDHA
jgi:hypothetical protein